MSVERLTSFSVFFVKDAQRSLGYYQETLGFAVDWIHEEGGRPFVFRVSLFGFELILNQVEEGTKDRAGHGRVFIGLDEDQAEIVLRHIDEKAIKTSAVRWGAPTLVIHDLDQNELFLWLPEKHKARVERLLGA